MQAEHHNLLQWRTDSVQRPNTLFGYLVMLRWSWALADESIISNLLVGAQELGELAMTEVAANYAQGGGQMLTAATLRSLRQVWDLTHPPVMLSV